MLSLKNRAEVCAVYAFPLILYRLALLPLPRARRLALQRSLSRLLCGGQRPMVRRQVCIQHTRNGGLGMPDLENYWLAERLAYLGRSLTGDAVWRGKVGRNFPRLKFDPKPEGQRKPMGETSECRAALRNFSRSSDLSRPQKELYQELVVGSDSHPLSGRHGWKAEGFRSHRNWAPGSSFLNHSEFSLTWRLARPRREEVTLSRLGLQSRPDSHARLCSLWQWFRRNGWDHAGEWTARIERSSCSWNVDLDDTKKGIVWWCKLFSSWSGFVF